MMWVVVNASTGIEAYVSRRASGRWAVLDAAADLQGIFNKEEAARVASDLTGVPVSEVKTKLEGEPSIK